MTVSNQQYLSDFYDASKALGKKIINSDFTFEIEGFEGLYLLAKQCPWPVTSVGGDRDSVDTGQQDVRAATNRVCKAGPGLLSGADCGLR